MLVDRFPVLRPAPSVCGEPCLLTLKRVSDPTGHRTSLLQGWLRLDPKCPRKPPHAQLTCRKPTP